MPQIALPTSLTCACRREHEYRNGILREACRALVPQFSVADAAWTNLLNGVYHCPTDQRSASWSYG